MWMRFASTDSRRTGFRQIPNDCHGADQREPAKGRSVAVDSLLKIDTRAALANSTMRRLGPYKCQNDALSATNAQRRLLDSLHMLGWWKGDEMMRGIACEIEESEVSQCLK